MIYFILCIVNIIALLPFVYRLADFVYDCPVRKIGIIKILPRSIFFCTFGFLFGFWCVFSVVLLYTLGSFTVMSARLDVGCSVLFVLLVYFIRCIPIYYKEGSTVQDARHYKRTFVKELVYIAVLVAALETVSFELYAYLVSAAVGAVCFGLRIKKFIGLRKKYNRNGNHGR